MDYNLARSLSLVINEGFDIIIASADFLICELKYLVLVSNHLLVLRTLRPRVSTHLKKYEEHPTELVGRYHHLRKRYSSSEV